MARLFRHPRPRYMIGDATLAEDGAEILSVVTKIPVGTALGVLITGALAYDVLSNNYTYAEMDWDQDGHTAIGEMLHGSDTLSRSM